MKLKTEAQESTEKLDIKRRKCTLSENIQKLLLRQLKHELYNHNLYMSFSNFYGVQGLAVLEQYYKERADEEYHHHSWIRTYMNENDAAYIYPDIPAISETFEDNFSPKVILPVMNHLHHRIPLLTFLFHKGMHR